MTDEEGGLPHLADRLNVLFAQVHTDSTQPYSNDRAAEKLRAAGVNVTGAYLGQLRLGKKNNPSARLLAGIAELFMVPITYFFDADRAAEIDRDLGTVLALRDPRIRNLVERAAGLSDTGIDSLTVIVEQLRRMEDHRAG